MPLYVIYCTNNYHNLYMDYTGNETTFQNATVFDNLAEAHSFLREKGPKSVWKWAVINIDDLTDDDKNYKF